MKKRYVIFGGQCIVILTLLVLIALFSDKSENVVKKDEYIVEASETEELEWVEETEKTINELSKKGENDLSNSVSEPIAVSGNTINAAEELKTIVVFGDSMWYTHDEEIGIPALIEEQLNVKIYNCAIGGTTAAVTGDSADLENWTSNSFNGMVYIARDKLDGEDIIAQDKAYEILKDVDFEEIDYVIVSYGLNDYFFDVPVYPETYYDMKSYVGALRHGIHKLRKDYPHLEFIITSPTYCEWFKGERQYDVGAYVEAARSVADEMDAYFLDMYHALGKNPDEKMKYISDGVHLNPEGERLYAHSVIECLKELGVQEIE